MTQGKHFAAGGDHFAALPNKKIHTPKGIARLTVTAATMAAMTGSSLISPFTAFAQTGDGGTQHPAVMSPIAAHAGAASGTGAKSAAQAIADLQKAVDEAKAKEDAAKASYDEAAGPYNEAASAREPGQGILHSAVSAGTAADRAAMDEYARQVAEARTPPMPPARTSSRRRRVSQTPRRMRPRRTKRTSPPSRRPRMPRMPSIRPRQMP